MKKILAIIACSTVFVGGAYAEGLVKIRTLTLKPASCVITKKPHVRFCAPKTKTLKVISIKKITTGTNGKPVTITNSVTETVDGGQTTDTVTKIVTDVRTTTKTVTVTTAGTGQSTTTVTVTQPGSTVTDTTPDTTGTTDTYTTTMDTWPY